MRDSENRFRLAVRVVGRVQGVGFRMFVVQRAQALGLTGWVRNTRAGDVELVAEGARPALEQLLEAVRQGPRGGRVVQADAQWDAYQGEFTGFEIWPTL